MKRYWFLIAIALVSVISLVRVFTGTDQITSGGTIRAALIATAPILMAGLGGLWAERAGVVNIGLEGQMILGTWGAAYFTYQFGPWVGVLGGALFGMLGGLLHAIAAITFNVDHIVSGVAINLIGAGTAVFLAEAIFPSLKGGGPRQLIGLETPTRITIPGISDWAIALSEKHWFFISDLAGVVVALTTGISSLIVLIFATVIATSLILWRTKFGLRLRSCGENPQAAETLGVNVYLYKYVAVLISGAFAGIGGASLALVSSSGFNTGQTGGRGYIGLAAMIFGNWRPGSLFSGALLFGYTEALRLRDPEAVHTLLLIAAIVMLAIAVWMYFRSANRLNAAILGGVGLVVGLLFVVTDTIPREFTGMTPYIATMLVLALGTQRLRMPAADGKPYTRGAAG